MNIKKAKKNALKKHKFNIVDVAVIVVLAVIISVAIQWINPFAWIPTEAPAEERTVLFTVELREVEKKHASSVRVDDNVVLLTDGIDIGTVVEVKKASSGKWVAPEEGDIMVLEKDHTKTIKFSQHQSRQAQNQIKPEAYRQYTFLLLPIHMLQIL